MRTSIISRMKSTFTCGRCSMVYLNYKHLLEHLYWRHGTESSCCKHCPVKRWQFAVHVCHVLPIYEDTMIYEDEESDINSGNSKPVSDFCSCGQFEEDAPMIGCDGANCHRQWFHFACVGITTPPDGEWLCPTCEKSQKINQNNQAKAPPVP